MTVEIQNELIDALKTLTLALGSDDYCTLGLGLVRFAIGGLRTSHAEMQATAASFVGSVLNKPYLAEELIQTLGLKRASEETLRRELGSLTDGQGLQLRDDALELVMTGPAMMARGMRSIAETMASPPGQLRKLSSTQS